MKFPESPLTAYPSEVTENMNTLNALLQESPAASLALLHFLDMLANHLLHESEAELGGPAGWEAVKRSIALEIRQLSSGADANLPIAYVRTLGPLQSIVAAIGDAHLALYESSGPVQGGSC